MRTSIIRCLSERMRPISLVAFVEAKIRYFISFLLFSISNLQVVDSSVNFYAVFGLSVSVFDYLCKLKRSVSMKFICTMEKQT